MTRELEWYEEQYNMTIKHPNIEVELTGKDGNAFSIIATVTRALKEASIDKHEIDQFWDEATSGGYQDLLVTCMKWVTVK